MTNPCKHHTRCMLTALVRAEQICRKQQVRLTPTRKRVLELIWQGHEPIKAYDLLAELQKTDASAKPPTVYRALDFLLEHKLVHKLHSLNAYVGCAHPHESVPCFFLICSQCHTVTEQHNEAHEQLITSLCQSQQFDPRNMTFEIEGVCQRCA